MLAGGLPTPASRRRLSESRTATGELCRCIACAGHRVEHFSQLDGDTLADYLTVPGPPVGMR
ncbi:hypothetical protein [Micromonospora sp. 4G55]|uniref:hypothetical protein n=1 Tax=Micromonospora sp. 4G55 TaxID=2806102 RepID=UPI001A39C6EA|nr:hypothetical protein [Micromonospora sp. 4G55]MBM0257081.1 hypothetical protein [Micromonospora sp. 4G55]